MSDNLEKKIEEIFAKAGLKPRPFQVEVAAQLAEQLNTNPVVGLEAPTGFGKTATVLSAIKATQLLPAVWRVRAYALARHIAEQTSLFELRPYIAGGRERLCPRRSELGPSLPFVCRYFKHRCKFYTNILPEDVSATSFEELEHRYLQEEKCPYYLQLYVKSDVFITTYALGLPLPNNITIYDEAHNILRVESLSLPKVREALSELNIPKALDDLHDPKLFVEKHLPELLDALEAGKKLYVAPRLFNLASQALASWIDDNELHFISLIRPRFRAILISATLTPLQKILGVSIIKVPPQRRLKAFLTTWLTTRYESYDLLMSRHYNDLIFLLKKYFARLIVFATWRVGALLHVDFTEDHLQIPGFEKEFTGSLLLNPRGRWSEGVDLPADAVLVAGAPYPPPSARVERVGLNMDDIVSITTLQAIGRATRDPSQNPIIILGDYRFEKIKLLNDYLDIEYVNSLQDLDKKLRELRQQSQQQSTPQQPS